MQEVAVAAANKGKGGGLQGGIFSPLTANPKEVRSDVAAAAAEEEEEAKLG